MNSPNTRELEARLRAYSFAGAPAYIAIGLSLHALNNPGGAVIGLLDDARIAGAVLGASLVYVVWEGTRIVPILRALAAARKSQES